MNEKLRNNFTGWFCLRGYQEFATKMLAGALVILKLNWYGTIVFQGCSLPGLASWGWHLVRSLSSSPCGLVHMPLVHPDSMAAGFPHSKQPKILRQKLGLRFYYLVMGIAHRHFCSILLSHSSAPFNVGGNYIRARRPGSEDPRGHLVAGYYHRPNKRPGNLGGPGCRGHAGRVLQIELGKDGALGTYELPTAAITKYHKLDSLHFSQFWRLESLDQGGSMVVFW